MVTLLTESEVVDLIDLQAAIACMETAYQAQADGQITAWPPSMMRSGGGLLIMRSGGLPERHHYGTRISTGPNAPAYALIFESPGGNLLSLVEYPFSDLRVGATVGLAVNRLAPSDVQRMAVIGTSRIAWTILEGAHAVRQPTSITVYSRGADHRAEFAARIEKELEIAASPTETAEAALKDADVVLVATAATEPVVRADWLPAHALVVGAGERAELAEDVYRKAACVITTSKVHDQNQRSWPLLEVIKSGDLTWDAVAELGEIISGHRQAGDGLTVFREAQGGFSDIALASLAYEKAVALGRGQAWAS